MLLITCVIIMVVLMLCFYQNRIYRITNWKLLIAVLLMVFTGFISVHLMFYIERNAWGGRSFFGCVFMVPPVIYIYAKIVKIKTEYLMDIAGPVCAITLTLMKLHCLYEECCGGIILTEKANGIVIRFPSQIIEAICGLIICLVLLHLQRKQEYRGNIAPIFLIMYGTSRYILDFFRIDLTIIRFLEGTGIYLTEGHFWALICIIWGLIWLNHRRKKEYRLSN